jgi:hypothetical protein
MREGGPGPRRPQAPSLGGRSQVGLLEPASEGSRAGPTDVRLGMAQGDSDQHGSPGGVFPSLLQSGLADGLRVSVRARLWGAIIGLNCGLAFQSEAFQEMADGAFGQIEGGGEFGCGLAASGTLEQGLTEGYGSGLGHGGDFRED